MTNSVRRLLFCSGVAPQRTGAGELLVYRHLSRLDDWEVVVVTPPNRPADEVFRRRISTPMSPAIRQILRLRRGLCWTFADGAAGSQLMAGFAGAVDAFRPEIVVSVLLPDVHLTAAARYARHAGIPLALFCHDDYHRLSSPRARVYLQAMYRQASVRFCVSEVMRQEFARRYGVAGLTLFPMPERKAGNIHLHDDQSPLVVGYAGAIGNGYEAAMLALCEALAARGGRLVIASRTPRTIAPAIWLHPVVRDLGPLDPAQVEGRLIAEGANVLLVVQSFDPAESEIRFNFPSKLTEYMTFGLPILVAAPSYAGAAQWLAEEPEAALLVTRPVSEAFAATLAQLSRADQRLSFAKSAARVGSRYSPDRLGEVFEAGLLAAINPGVSS